jgi:hypothetical protein
VRVDLCVVRVGLRVVCVDLCVVCVVCVGLRVVCVDLYVVCVSPQPWSGTT